MCQRNLVLSVCFMMSGLLMCCSPGTFRLRSAKEERVSLQELVKNREHYASRLKQRQRVVLALKKGERIPMSLALETGFLSLKSRENLIVERDLCVLLSKRTVALSPDCVTFAPMWRSRALKKLFGFSKGSLSVGLSLGKEGIAMPVTIRAQ